MSLSPGDRLGRYEILEPIGAGGMGRVFRARDTNLGLEVAVKLLPEDVADDPKRHARFEREAHAGSRLDHPNICAVRDFGTDGAVPYAIMELLDGRDLRALLSEGALPWRRAVGIAVQAARGLEAAHRKGVFHRDLKPSNLFITTDGTVKILDFGLARLADPDPFRGDGEASPTTLTEAGVVMGTAAYMSPEQVRGRPADIRSDIFALGCVLHEMLSGGRPFCGDSSAEVMSAILRDDPAPIRQAVPRSLRDLVERCLAKEPEGRPQSAAEVLAVLGEIRDSGDVDLVSEPATADSRSGGSFSKSFLSNRHPAAWAAAVGLVGLIIAWAIVGWQQSTRVALPQPDLDPHRIAVVPFVNRTGQADLDSLGLRAADVIAGLLSEMDDLRVVPPSAIAGMPARDLSRHGIDPRSSGAAAAATSAGLVVSGVVDTAGDEIEIRGVLEDATEGRVVRSFGPTRADRRNPSPAIQALSADVFISTSDHLRPVLTFGAGEEWPDLETYREFSRYSLEFDRPFSGAFRTMLQEHPELRRLRLCVALMYHFANKFRAAKETLDSETLDESLLNHHQIVVTRALRAWAEGQHEHAFRLLRDELDASPRNLLLRLAAIRCALLANRPRQALEIYDGFVPVEPAPPTLQLALEVDAARAHHAVGEYADGIRLLAHIRAEAPSTWMVDWAALNLTMLLGATGDVEAIERLLEETAGVELPPTDLAFVRIPAVHELRAHGFREASDVMAEKALGDLDELLGPSPSQYVSSRIEQRLEALLLAHRNREAASLASGLERDEVGWVSALCLRGIAAARVGDADTARVLFERLNEIPESDPLFNTTWEGDLRVGQAMIAAQLGDLEESLDLLRDAALLGTMTLYNPDLRHNAFFEPLWDHPEFQEILQPRD